MEKIMPKWKIYFDTSCGSKFGEASIYNSNKRPETPLEPPFILISHKTGRELEKDLSTFGTLESAEALCYISGAEQCGLSAEEISDIESRYNKHVHIYRGSIPNINVGETPSIALVRRFEDFISQTSTKDPSEVPDWKLLYPTMYPDELVAVYLFMTAQKMGVSLQSSFSEDVWSKAGQQFCDRGGASRYISEVNWKGCSTENLDSCLSDMRNLFAKIDNQR
jgi:hypothetical protein